MRGGTGGRAAAWRSRSRSRSRRRSRSRPFSATENGVALAEALSADQTAAPEAVELTATPLEETPLEGEKTEVVEEPDAAEKNDAAEEADPVAVETWEWSGHAGNLALSSEGLTLDADALDAALTEAVPGTLDLTLSLDPAADGTDTGNHTVVLPGDTLTVPLPEGVTVTGGALDVYQLDAAGAPTALKVASAEPVQDGAALRVTFVEPVDPATGAAYYVGVPTRGPSRPPRQRAPSSSPRCARASPSRSPSPPSFWVRSPSR